MKKADAQEMLDAMPDEFDAEELMYRLELQQKLERAEADIAAGRLIPHEEIERQINEWLK